MYGERGQVKHDQAGLPSTQLMTLDMCCNNMIATKDMAAAATAAAM